MKRLLLGPVVLCAAFVVAQQTRANPANSNSQSTSASAPGQQTATPPAANVPSGTKVKARHTDTLVQPVNKPVKITPSEIKAAQEKLDTKGYDAGPADGRMGPRTRAALRHFQADEGLSQTGRLDQETLAKLDIGAVNTLGAAPADLGRGGKAFGHDIKQGHPEAAGKAIAHGTENFGRKVGQGTVSGAIGIKNKVGEGVSKAADKVSGKKPESNRQQPQ
jgi:peptidoglycan hydrolase-like protein with peptidoglycan-binding domain